jgi:hypothetical protein
MPQLLASEAPIAFEYRIDVMMRDLKDDGSAMIDLLQVNHTIFGIESRKDGYTLVDFDPKVPYENALALPKSRVDVLKRILTS